MQLNVIYIYVYGWHKYMHRPVCYVYVPDWLNLPIHQQRQLEKDLPELMDLRLVGGEGVAHPTAGGLQPL